MRAKGLEIKHLSPMYHSPMFLFKYLNEVKLQKRSCPQGLLALKVFSLWDLRTCEGSSKAASGTPELHNIGGVLGPIIL